jgi:iron complex transport system substrate-binding protein
VTKRYNHLTTNRYCWSVLRLFALALLVAACGRTPAPNQRSVQRIVSLSPAATEALYAVGCGPQLVLRDAWSDWPKEALQVPAVAGFTPSPEAILAAKPDLVLVHFPAPALRQALERAGVRWQAFAPETLAEVAASLSDIGAACGQPAAGKAAAAALLADVAQIRAGVAGKPRPRVFYEMDATDSTRPYTVAKRAFAHDLLLVAGADNVFATADVPWLQVSTESVLAADPDLIVLADSDAELAAQTPAMVAARPGWQAMRAVQQGKIVAVPGQLLGRPGPRIVQGLRLLVTAIHGPNQP